MSSTNLGSQSLNIAYTQNFTSETYNKRLNKITKPGIYEGGQLSYTAPNLTVGAFVAEFRCSTGQNIRGETTTNIVSDITALKSESNPITLTELKPYVTASFSWVNSATNYIDFTEKGSGEITNNDIVFGKGVYVGGVLTSFDYSEKTFGLIDDNDNVFANALIINDMNNVSSGVVQSGLVLTNKVDGSNLVGFLDGVRINIPFTVV